MVRSSASWWWFVGVGGGVVVDLVVKYGAVDTVSELTTMLNI